MGLIVIGQVKETGAAKRLKRIAGCGRTFVNDQEVFHLSRTKARRLAYRWRGSRRGKRIAAWLASTKNSNSFVIENPVERRLK